MKDPIYHAYFKSPFLIFQNNESHTKQCIQATLNECLTAHPDYQNMVDFNQSKWNEKIVAQILY